MGKIGLTKEMLDRYKTCTWQQDENGLWWTDCHNIHDLFDGTPTENKHTFCPYCGKRIEEVMV